MNESVFYRTELALASLVHLPLAQAAVKQGRHGRKQGQPGPMNEAE